MLRTSIIIALESGVVSPDFIIVQGLNGVAYGLLIFLLAAGLTLIFGMLHVVNLAHGSFFMIGAYIGYSAARALNFWAALLIAPIVVGLVGIVIEIGLLKHIYRRPLLDQVILTFGLSFMAAEIVRMIWGGAARRATVKLPAKRRTVSVPATSSLVVASHFIESRASAFDHASRRATTA